MLTGGCDDPLDPLVTHRCVGNRQTLVNFMMKIPLLQESDGLSIRAFTTQPDTVYGVSFLAVSLDHEILKEASLLDSHISQQLKDLGNVTITSNKRKGDTEGVRGVICFSL